MAFTNADLLAIKSELTNNPLALSPGYQALTAENDEANANALNLVRTATAIDRESIPTNEIMLHIDRDEFLALSAGDRQWLLGVGQGGSVNPKQGGEVREGIFQMFAVGTESRTNLLAIVTEPASRIDHLYKAGTLSQGGLVTPSDVANARNAT